MDKPLALKLAPKSINDIIGQRHLIGSGKILTNLVKNKKIFSMILYGKPGIGKTAIVEGLAYRIQRGEVPEALLGYTIYRINTTALLTNNGEENRVLKLVNELKEKEKVILFIDEIHTLIGNDAAGAWEKCIV